MYSITHIDELNYLQFYLFIKEYFNDNVYLSEKIDGQNISLGKNELGTFFTKSKNSKPVFYSEFYSNHEHMTGFKAIHEFFDYSNLPSSTQLFFELLTYSKSNNIEYDKIKLFPALIYIKGNIPFEEIPKQTEITILNTPVIPYTQLNSNYFNEYEKLFLENKDNLSKRNDGIKLIKNKLTELQLKIKEEFIEQVIPKTSYFSSSKPEGIVIETPNFKVKIVDKNQFTTENMENHKTSDDLKQLKRKYNNIIIKEIFNNADILLNNNKLESLINEFQFINPLLSKTDIVIHDLMKENRIKINELTVSQLTLLNQILQSFNLEFNVIKNDWNKKDKTNLSELIVNSINFYISELDTFNSANIVNMKTLLKKLKTILKND